MEDRHLFLAEDLTISRGKAEDHRNSRTRSAIFIPPVTNRLARATEISADKLILCISIICANEFADIRKQDKADQFVPVFISLRLRTI